MGGRRPEETDALIDEALRRGDAGDAAALFEEDAVFVVPGTGDAVAGRDAIRETFQELLAEGVPDFESSVRAVFVAGDIALVLSDWRTASSDDGTLPQEGTATDVMRRQPDGTWLYVIDNPDGVGPAGPA